MSKYLILYRSQNSAAEQLAGQDPAAAEASMQAWMTWAQKAGDAVVDFGMPTQSVAGAPDGQSFVGGYSIMQADSADEIQTVLEGHPHLESGGTIEVLELLAMPGM
ncbi:YciI family protein [Cellulomonas sp. WB94]|uniref:YciI family protein n=1 Tax=Cellulomonas sp. WB94 TaxID=2173174 RepID=UPI001304BC40|nr:YciI family protein [Cellulomonas sp. WB94]